MKIIAQDGVETDLVWWDKMRVNKASVVLEAERDGEIKELTIARCRAKAKADALFAAINDGIKVQKKVLNVHEWNKNYVPAEAVNE